MNRITNNFGLGLFSRLEETITGQESHKSQIAAMRRMLYSLFKKLTTNENIDSDSLYDRQQWFFGKYRYEGIARNKSHRLRILCNNCVHDEIENKKTKEVITFSPTAGDYISAIVDLSDLISHFSDFETPESIKTLLQQEKKTPVKLEKQLMEEDLVNNPDPRIPVVMVLDTSSSMMIKDNGKDTRMDILNDGMRQFFKDVIEDERTRDAVEVCVVTFDDTINIVSEFNKPERQTIHNLKAKGGQTLMNQGVDVALELLEKRKQEYRDSGVEYYQPWLVLMTDGIPTESIESSAEKTSKLALHHKLTLFPVGISDGANLDTLNRFSPLRPSLRLKDYHFKEFFEWLHKSAIKVSQSTPDVESIALPKPTKNWFEN